MHKTGTIGYILNWIRWSLLTIGNSINSISWFKMRHHYTIPWIICFTTRYFLYINVLSKTEKVESETTTCDQITFWTTLFRDLELPP